MSKIVSMHFGDGSSKQIEIEDDEAKTKEEAEEAARTWVSDNAWFEADPDQDWDKDGEAPNEPR